MLKILPLLFILSACSYKEEVRPYLQNLIGESLSNSILGAPPVVEVVKEITLPPIPKVEKDATSVKSNISEENINKNSIPSKKMKDLNVFFIREVYQEVYGVEVEQKKLTQWINVLEQGGTREGVYRALINDVEFLKLAEKPKPLTNNSIDFVEHFSKTYLKLQYSKETLEKANFYSLKSDLTDSTLEVMDAFSGRFNELYDWYAVLSADLATRYPMVFKFETRKNTSKEFHRGWAASVPIQMIKSEVIIKLQQVLNTLNK
jgi:hypothetical protein